MRLFFLFLLLLGLDVGVDFTGIHQIERVDFKEWGPNDQHKNISFSSQRAT